MFAAGAGQLVEVAVDVDNLARPGATVQAVDILGERPDGVEMILDFGDDEMPAIRDGRPRWTLELDDGFPGPVRVSSKPSRTARVAA